MDSKAAMYFCCNEKQFWHPVVDVGTVRRLGEVVGEVASMGWGLVGVGTGFGWESSGGR